MSGDFYDFIDVVEREFDELDAGLRRTVYRLVVPGKPITVNAARRLHFQARAAHDRQWREAGWAAAKEAKVPRLDRVAITVQTLRRHQRSSDLGSELPSAKAAIDGIADACLPDDSPRHVWRLTFLAPVLGAERDALVLDLEVA